MSMLDSLKSFLFVDDTEDKPLFKDETTTDTTVDGIKDSYYLNTSSTWQYYLALNRVSDLLYSSLSNVEWKTYNSKKELLKGDVYYHLNWSPNKRQTSNEFYRLVAQKLIFLQECLIVELADKQLYVADTFQFKNGVENAITANTFVNVTIGNAQLNRSFKEGVNAIYIKYQFNDVTNSSLSSMISDYNTFKSMIIAGAEKAMGTKLNLAVESIGKNLTYDEFLERTKKQYREELNKANSVIVTFKGETLNDLTEKQRGSEVEQVLNVVQNNVDINKEIYSNVARAYGIPQAMMNMEITTDSEDVDNIFMTQFVKPILTLLSNRFSIFYLDQESILQGAKIEADLQTINYVDVLRSASSMDKLISSGVYTINEIRGKVGDIPVKDGDTRFITKNYATLSGYVKGEE